MKPKSLSVIFNLVLTQTTFAEIVRNGFQNVPSNQAVINFNNLTGARNLQGASTLPGIKKLPGGSNLLVADDQLAHNTLSILNSLPAEKNLPANQLHLGLPFTYDGLVTNNRLLSNYNNVGNEFQVNNFLANGLPAASKFSAKNYLANDFLVVNNLSADNFLPNNIPVSDILENSLPAVNAFLPNVLTNNLPTANKFPVKTYLTNNLAAIDNFPTNNYAEKSFLAVNNLPASNNLPGATLTAIYPSLNQPINNLANNVFTQQNSYLTSGPVFPNKQANINQIVKANDAPNAIKKLSPDGLVVRSGFQVINNFISDVIENNALTKARQVSSTNNIVPINNTPIRNALTLSNELPFNPQAGYIWIAPAPLPLYEDASVVKVSTGNTENNIIVPGNTLVMDKSVFPINKALQYNNVPNINSLQNYPNNCLKNDAQSFLTIFPATDMSNLNIDKIHHWQSNTQNAEKTFLTKPMEHLLADDVPANNLLLHDRATNNLPNIRLPEINMPSCNLPTSNIALNIPFVNNMNVPRNNIFSLGELNSLPIMNGLPVIGVTETVTVINTAPSLY